MNWLLISIFWYLILFLLGVVFIPITKKIFGKIFYDFGYPFSKALAILLLTYAVFILGTAKIIAFTQLNLILVTGLFLLINIIFLKTIRNKKLKNPSTDYSLLLIFIEEILFLFSLLFWAYVRGQEPSIRGLEKFMDFGFMNSILRSKYFPPLDMWLSADATHPTGYPINYYYFGHLVGALLIKLSGVKAAIGYNLILASIFALGITQVFSLVFNMCYLFLKKKKSFVLDFGNWCKLVFFGAVGSFMVNLGGNLHTIYVFTSGYPNDNPIPFWQILGQYNPLKYWYPNATRFIPFTIHEFPSYSYVVADLHGHVFDIPFVLLTIAILFKLFISYKEKIYSKSGQYQISNIKYQKENLISRIKTILNTEYWILNTVFLGFLAAVHYMTNAFDGPIYLLLTMFVFLFIYGLRLPFFLNTIVLIISFTIYSLPFSLSFSPFVSGIGVNCSANFLTKMGRLGPFLFEKGNCQVSPPWMLFVLWGFFWTSFIIFILIKQSKKISSNAAMRQFNHFLFILFSFGTLLILIPEFFYIKDIYPAHFRANTMFKLGYQAFMMMGIASMALFFQIKFLDWPKRFFFNLVFIIFFFFVAIYPAFSIPSYYGKLDKLPNLDGGLWLKDFNPDDKEIVDFINSHIAGQPIILEAQGDSYADYERISANTGLPTVAGWWVHEWLWRGSPDVVGKRIPDIVNIYESEDLNLTRSLLRQYRVKYVIISGLEKEKYSHLQKDKFTQLGKVVFQTKSLNGAIYQVD